MAGIVEDSSHSKHGYKIWHFGEDMTTLIICFFLVSATVQTNYGIPLAYLSPIVDNQTREWQLGKKVILKKKQIAKSNSCVCIQCLGPGNKTQMLHNSVPLAQMEEPRTQVLKNVSYLQSPWYYWRKHVYQQQTKLNQEMILNLVMALKDNKPRTSLPWLVYQTRLRLKLSK